MRTAQNIKYINFPETGKWNLNLLKACELLENWKAKRMHNLYNSL